MRKRPLYRLALVENFPRGIDHEPGVHDRGIDRYQDGKSIFPSAVSLDAAIDADAVSADGLYFSNGCAKKFRHSAFGYSHSSVPRSSSFLSLPHHNHDGKKTQGKSQSAHNSTVQIRKSSHDGCSYAGTHVRSHLCALTLPNIETKKTLAISSARDTAPEALAAENAPQPAAASATISGGLHG